MHILWQHCLLTHILWQHCLLTTHAFELPHYASTFCGAGAAVSNYLVVTISMPPLPPLPHQAASWTQLLSLVYTYGRSMAFEHLSAAVVRLPELLRGQQLSWQVRS